MPAKNQPRRQNKNTSVPEASMISDDHDPDMYETMCEKMLEDLEGMKCKSEPDKIAVSVAKLLIPMMSKSVKLAVDSVTVNKPQFEKAKANIRLVKYETDKLEQYTRRENIRIHNLAHDPTKGTLTDTVLEMLNEMLCHNFENGTPPRLEDKDISVCHYAGKKPQIDDSKPRQILVRFVSRKSVYLVFKYKKNLGEMAKYKNIFISDDLTLLRMKLKGIVKSTPGVTKVHSVDGNIHCDKDNKHFVISTPDDLFDIGVDVDLEQLGLAQFI